MHERMTMVEQPMGTACAACGFINPSKESLCLACGLGLARAPQTVDPTEERYRRIASNVEQLRQGHVTLEQFVDFIEAMQHTVTEEGQALCDYFETSGYYQESPLEVETGVAGLQSYEVGLSELRQFAEDLDETHLEAGLQTVREGNDKILEAMRLNRERRDRLADEWTGLSEAREEFELQYS